MATGTLTSIDPALLNDNAGDAQRESGPEQTSSTASAPSQPHTCYLPPGNLVSAVFQTYAGRLIVLPCGTCILRPNDTTQPDNPLTHNITQSLLAAPTSRLVCPNIPSASMQNLAHCLYTQDALREQCLATWYAPHDAAFEQEEAHIHYPVQHECLICYQLEVAIEHGQFHMLAADPIYVPLMEQGESQGVEGNSEEDTVEFVYENPQDYAMH